MERLVYVQLKQDKSCQIKLLFWSTCAGNTFPSRACGGKRAQLCPWATGKHHQTHYRAKIIRRERPAQMDALVGPDLMWSASDVSTQEDPQRGLWCMYDMRRHNKDDEHSRENSVAGILPFIWTAIATITLSMKKRCVWIRSAEGPRESKASQGKMQLYFGSSQHQRTTNHHYAG